MLEGAFLNFFSLQAVYASEGNSTIVGADYTKLRKSRDYVVAYHLWYRIITTIALPFFAMMYCNICIFNYYKKNR